MTLPLSWKGRRVRYPRSLVPSFSPVEKDDQTWMGPVPVTSPLRTIKDCREAQVEPDLVAQAISEALERGLFRIEELEHD